jgi:hypothetical protein
MASRYADGRKENAIKKAKLATQLAAQSAAQSAAEVAGWLPHQKGGAPEAPIHPPPLAEESARERKRAQNWLVLQKWRFSD